MKTRVLIITLFLGLFGVGLLLFLKMKPKEKGTTEEPAKEVKETLMRIESSAFSNNQKIPSKYTCDGENISPPLDFLDVPPETKSLVLIVDDPDAPAGTWVHWLVWNIKPGIREIAEGIIPEGAVSGMNNFGKLEYGGPCPPSGTHRYFFKLYALDSMLDLDQGAKKEDLEEAMKNHIIAQGELVGLYGR